MAASLSGTALGVRPGASGLRRARSVTKALRRPRSAFSATQKCFGNLPRKLVDIGELPPEPHCLAFAALCRRPASKQQFEFLLPPDQSAQIPDTRLTH